MIRPRTLALVALVAAACSGTKEKPGALLHGPAALAAFDGIVAHDDFALRPYLAVANERGDELRLIDLADNHVVESPGLAFPLSIPFVGRPMLVASADLHQAGRPSALAVVQAGTNVVDLIDTWSGYPTAVGQVALASDGEVLAIAGVAVTDGAATPQPVAGRARFVVALTGGRLEVIELTRGTGDEIVAAAPVTVSGLPYDVTSLSQAAEPGFVYAGSLDLNPGYGIAKIALPANLAGAGHAAWYPTGVPIQHVAAVSYAFWDFATDTFAAAPTERVVAVPSPSACLPGKSVCGMLLVDPSTGGLATGWAPSESAILPMALPAPVTGLVAAGRAASALMPLVSGAGTANTTALAAVTTTDGAVYFVDVAHWAMISESSPLVGTGRTRVSSAASTVHSGSGPATIGLSDGVATTVDPKLLPARVKVTPGFTPDDDWKLTWEGILPGLDGRGAIFSRSGSTRAVTVQVGTGPVYASADLVALGVQAGDLVGIAGIEPYCDIGTIVTAAAAPAGNQVTVMVPPGDCLEAVPDGASLPVFVTVRASGLVLTGTKTGHAGRPTSGVPFTFAGTRQFYVTDPCTSAECAANWPGLTFPFPSGNALEFTAVTVGTPAMDDALHFTTKSGVVPTARRPIVEGTVIGSVLPLGLALRDTGGTGVGASVYASFNSGVVAIFNTGSAANAMAVVR